MSRRRQQGPFAGLAREPGGGGSLRGGRTDGADVAELHVRGLAAPLLDDARAAEFSSGPEHLVPCGAEAVDRFDGRLLLDDVARWAARAGSAGGAGAPLLPTFAGEDATESQLDAERYRDLNPDADRPARRGGDYSDQGEDEGGWLTRRRRRRRANAAAAALVHGDQSRRQAALLALLMHPPIQNHLLGS